MSDTDDTLREHVESMICACPWCIKTKGGIPDVFRGSSQSDTTDTLREQILQLFRKQKNCVGQHVHEDNSAIDDSCTTPAKSTDQAMHLISQDRAERDIDSRIEELQRIVGAKPINMFEYLEVDGQYLTNRLAELKKQRKDSES